MKKEIKITKIRPLQLIEEDGTINLDCDALNLDWIRAARLLRRIKEGDKKAEAEYEALQAQKVVEVEFKIIDKSENIEGI